MNNSINIIAAVLIFFSLATTAQAQFQMKVGPQLGLNFNIGTGSSLPETVTGFGMVFGGQVDMNFTPNIGLITNIQFYDNRSGSTSKFINAQLQNGTVLQNVEEEQASSLAYFMIEPLFKLSIPRSGFYFVGGPVVGFNIEASSTTTYTHQQLTQPQEFKTTLQNMLVRFGIKAGAGYDINLSNLVDLTPQFNFEFGITNTQSNFSARILTFQVLVGAKFKVL